MYMYIIEPGVECKIYTPGISDADHVHKEVIQQTPEKNIIRSTYSNGLVLEMHQEASRITVYSNRLLEQNPDGSYTAPEA